MTESELHTQSEIISKGMLGKPGQHFEVGMVFGGLVRVGELLVLYVPFVAEKPVQRLIIHWHLACYGWLVSFYVGAIGWHVQFYFTFF